ncbi:MAG: ABC transporter substrate-binding protein [Xanthomonadales bacterium]|nr:ABC transporter substrate-binding protein [Xanthomonadales bacterium]
MKRLLTVLALGVSLIAGLATAQPLTDPSPLISETAGSIFDKINGRREEIRDDPKIAEDIVKQDLLPLMDIEYSARLILGRDARKATPEQLRAFAEAMNSQLISKYAAGLLEFRSKEQIEVMDLKGDLNPRATRVKTRVKLESGGHALVDYVFRMTDEGWKVFDVVVEGISYIVSFQGQIRPEVQAHGLDAVIRRLNSGELDVAT